MLHAACALAHERLAHCMQATMLHSRRQRGDGTPTESTQEALSLAHKLWAISEQAERARGVGVVAVHACGPLTDIALRIAMLLRAPVAVMPCCYTSTSQGVPLGVRRALGVGMAADVQRSFRLSCAGYRSVDWGSVPLIVTPMNRMIVAAP